MSAVPILSTKCCNFRKRQYDENDNDEQIQSPEEFVRVIHFFFVVVDIKT